MDWLNTHPDVQKEIIATGVARCIDSARFSHCTGQIERRLFGATPPGDFGAWCLEQALSTTIRDAASFFIRKVAFALHRGRYDEEISRESVTTRIEHDEVLLGTFLQELVNLDVDDAQVVRIRQEDNAIKKRDQRKWHDLVKPHQAALLSNQGEPKLLHCLAVAYFGLSIHADGARPAERLHSLFGDDHGLVEAVLTGFKGTVSGSDIPDPAALLRLRSEGRANYLALPFLAGLEEQVSTENVLSDKKRSDRLSPATTRCLPVSIRAGTSGR